MEQNLDMSNVMIDIEAVKAQLAPQTTTNILDRISDDVIVATKFESTEFAELSNKSRQVYLVDLSQCELITEQWINGLKTLVLCTSLEEVDYEQANKGRFEAELADLLPDTVLSIKIRIGGEAKVLFIGYMDSNQAYRLLANYVRTAEKAKVYLENDGKLKEVTAKDTDGLRIHL